MFTEAELETLRLAGQILVKLPAGNPDYHMAQAAAGACTIIWSRGLDEISRRESAAACMAAAAAAAVKATAEASR